MVAHGPSHVAKLIDQVEDPYSNLPSPARLVLGLLIETLKTLNERIASLDVEIARRAREDENARRLATIPGIGPVTATALVALAPEATTFKRGRDFAAWLGLTPLQQSSGGKQSSARHRRWVSERCGVCSSLVRAPWCGKHANAVRRQDRGWIE